VQGFPLDDDPQVFGLHPNALITAQTNAANQFLSTVISVQPRSSSSGAGKSSEDIVYEMADEFSRRVPGKMKTKEAHPETYKKTPEGGIVSLGVFHGQEMTRFNALIERVKNTLVTLGKAIKGFVVMSAQLEDMFNAFIHQQVPGLWAEPISYPCLKPLNSWMTDFELRVAFMGSWLRQGPPVSYWVSCFYFPQGFMTCSKQVHARKTKIPIDALAFFTEPTSQTDGKTATVPEDGVNIHGLFIQGCGWDLPHKRMIESEKGILFVELPVIWMRVVVQQDFVQLSTQKGLYKCPLYKTSLRKGTLSTTGHSTNFVAYWLLPSLVEDQGHWVRRGVALLCMLDD